MQAREILIANTRTQSQNKVTTGAETLGELKAALDAEGIDYAGMTFTEGITKTSLLDDSSPLPKDVMYKGNTTNNLVILLTNTKKNIASGSAERDAVYQVIREKELQDEIKDYFGRNYTCVSTAELWDYINDMHLEEYDAEEEERSEEEEEGTTDTPKEVPVTDYLIENIYGIVKTLVKANVFNAENVADIRDLLDELSDRMKELHLNETTAVGNITISNADLNEMLSKI